MENLPKKWEWRKKRIPLPKYKRTKIVEKIKVKKVPGNKLSKQEVKNIERFNKLSLKILPEKLNVIKKPGLSIKEKRELQGEIDDLLSEEEIEESPRSGKVRIVKKPGVSLREKRKLAPEKIDITTDDEETSPKGGKVRTVKKPSSLVKEKREVETKESEYSPEEKQQLAGRDKGRIVKKPGLSIKDKNKLEKERAGHSVNDKNETNDTEVTGKSETHEKRKSRKDKFIENITLEEDRGMSQRSINNQFGGDYIEEEDYDGQYDNQKSQNDTHLPPIDTKYGASPQNSPTSSRKMTVHERLYDPDFRKNRSVPKEPEPVYIREFKSRPPKQLEHVKSKHMDPNYFGPRGEYVLETENDPTPQFKSKPPKNLEHVQSRHLSPEYAKKKQTQDEINEEKLNNVFVSRPPKNLEHIQSRIMDPKYLQEKHQAEEETYETEFKARLPKNLEHVQSRIMDPKYFQEKPPPAEEKYENEFKAKLPKKLEHVQSRILEPKKQRPASEEAETVSLPSFRARPPKHLEQVGSRILDPSFYEPRPEYVYESEEDNIDHNFKARLPKSLQHVESRALDPKYFKKKVPPIPTEDREAMNTNHNFKARLPKSLAHVQSRAFDPYYNKRLSPRNDPPVIELKQKGQVVVINVKKDPGPRSKSEGYKDRLGAARGKDVNYYNQWRNEFNEAEKQSGRQEFVEDDKPPEKKEKKPWRPPRKPKPEMIDKQYFDSWVMTPTHIYNDSNDMFYRNRRNVSEMWTSLARSIKKTVVENGERIHPIERTSYY